MSRSLSFVYLDGREVEGSSPRQVLEALRDGDAAAPPHDLGRFLDLVSSRGALTFSVTLEDPDRYRFFFVIGKQCTIGGKRPPRGGGFKLHHYPLEDVLASFYRS